MTRPKPKPQLKRKRPAIVEEPPMTLEQFAGNMTEAIEAQNPRLFVQVTVIDRETFEWGTSWRGMPPPAPPWPTEQAAAPEPAPKKRAPRKT